MSTSKLIRERASDHTQILASIAELDHAPSSLSAHMAYLEEIQVRYNKSESRLKLFSEASKRKYGELAKLRNSTAKPLVYKLVGMEEKLVGKENKLKREHQEALEQELGEREGHNAVSQLLDDAKQMQLELEAKARRLESLKEDLISLYREIFDGPTPEFPEDDRLEHHLQASQSLYINLQHIWNAERQTDDTLAAVDLKMLQCQEKVREALKYYETCTWSSGSSSRTDVLTNLEPRKAGAMQARLALGEAHSLISQVEKLCRQAQGVSLPLHLIKESNIALKSLLTTTIFDDPRRSKYGKNSWNIEFELENLYRIDDQLREQRGATQLRASVMHAQLVKAPQILDDCWRAIYNFRHSTFLRVVSEMEHTSGDHAKEIAHPTTLPDQS